MKRRAFITLLGGTAVTWPLAARAQQGVRDLVPRPSDPRGRQIVERLADLLTDR